MSKDRITKLRVSGLRAIEDITLNLNELTVLIGENGSGKSSIVEALEILRHAAAPSMLINDVIERRHGGLRTMLRHGAKQLRIEVWIDGAGPLLHYGFALEMLGAQPQIREEFLDVYTVPDAREPLHVLIRQGSKVRVLHVSQRKLVPGSGNEDSAEESEQVQVDSSSLALPWQRMSPQPAIGRTIAALSAIEVHSPFETRATWLQGELNLAQGARWPATVEIDSRLGRFGANLPNTYQEIRNRGPEHWAHTLDMLRLGLGHDLRDVLVAPAGRGMLEIRLMFGALLDHHIPAEFLSEGQLAYLCFVALCAPGASRSLLVFDEPELHLHPALVTRVTWLLEESSRQAPVIVATHSDQFLNSLHNPTSAVRVCELNASRATVIRCIAEDKLKEWLVDYSGFGDLRASGYADLVLESTDASAKEPKA